MKERNPGRRRPSKAKNEQGTQPRIRLIDVAEAAGFSTATVSQALSGNGRLPEETRRRIRLVSEELGYRPNAIARSLAKNTTSVIGLAVSQEGGPPFPFSGFEYFIQLVGGATEVALAHGYTLVLIPTALGGPTPAPRVELGGAIILDPAANDPLVRNIASGGRPVVTIGRMPDEPHDSEHCWVDNDAVAAAHAAIHHLERAGAQRIGLLASQPTTSYPRDCLQAYHQWCESTGAEPRIAIARGDHSGFEAATQLLARQDPPDAIFAILDQLAVGARLAAEVRNIRVPEDLLLVAGIDSRACTQGRPAITAVNLHPELLGRRSAELLLARLDNRCLDIAECIVPFKLTVRGSSQRSRRAVRASAR